MVNEYLSCIRMVKERAKAEGKALSDWLRRCRVTVGDFRGETFMKLLKLLVDIHIHTYIHAYYVHTYTQSFYHYPRSSLIHYVRIYTMN